MRVHLAYTPKFVLLCREDQRHVFDVSEQFLLVVGGHARHVRVLPLAHRLIVKHLLLFLLQMLVSLLVLGLDIRHLLLHLPDAFAL